MNLKLGLPARVPTWIFHMACLSHSMVASEYLDFCMVAQKHTHTHSYRGGSYIAFYEPASEVVLHYFYHTAWKHCKSSQKQRKGHRQRYPYLYLIGLYQDFTMKKKNKKEQRCPGYTYMSYSSFGSLNECL